MTTTPALSFKTAAAAIALATATSVAAAPAQATPVDTAAVHYVAQSGSADGGSLDNPIVGAGLIILAGVGVSIALAVGAGVAGGAFELPQIPGLSF